MRIIESLQGAKSCTDVLNLLRAGGALIEYRYSFAHHFGVNFKGHRIGFKPADGMIRVSFYEDYYTDYLGYICPNVKITSCGLFKFDLDLEGWEELQAFVKGIKPAKRVAV